MMQCFVYGGSFNHLDTTGFREAVSSQSWVAPSSVQLLLKNEGAEVFSLIPLTAT